MAENTSEGVRLGDVVKYETPFLFCRETLTIAQDAGATDALVIGELLEDNGAGAEVVVANGANCHAILMEDVTAATLIAGTSQALCLVRGPAVVDVDQVNCLTAELVAAVVALAALGIMVREEPTYTTL